MKNSKVHSIPKYKSTDAEPAPSLDQKMRDAGYTARPMPSRDPDEQQEEPVAPDREYWMIECKNGFVGWWTGGERCDCRFFNTDPNKGRRFDTKEEAEKVIATIGNSCQIATSHSWIDRGNPPAQTGEKP